MKVIPIQSAATQATTHAITHAASCDGESGEVPRLDLPLTRRELLRGTGILMGTLVAGTTVAALAPSPVWAVELKTLTKDEGRALMQLGRVLYPHKKLPDAVYALLAKDLDADAAKTPATAQQLKQGIAALNSAAGGSFVRANAATKAKVVKAIEGQPFFNTVRGKCITSLYDNDLAYAALGYPGSAWEKGGYITRGFQDLKWLPAPDLQASPKPYMG
jgi:hypothetical protein